jgi:hypothetical protein
MNTFLATIPQITDAPVVDDKAARPLASRPTSAPDADRSTGTAATAFSMGRRSFLRAAVVGGGALAVSMLGWVGERMPAFAATRTSISPGNCLGTDQPGDTPCWGADFISSLYCASDGYHRTDSHNYGPYTDFYNWRVGCGNYAGWTWHHPNGHSHRCTDGNIREVTNATGRSFIYTSICSKLL